MFTALSSMLEAAVSVGVDTAAGLLFEAEANPAALASLRQSGKDLSEPDELREAAETVCQAVEDDEQRRQLFTTEGTEADPFFMDLLLRSICSSDVVRMPDHQFQSFVHAFCCLSLTQRTVVLSRLILGVSER
jgi:hypothetical protein